MVAAIAIQVIIKIYRQKHQPHKQLPLETHIVRDSYETNDFTGKNKTRGKWQISSLR